MADKPSRSLVIFGDGHASLVSPSHSNLHAFASRASCGFLSLRIPPPDESEDDRVVRELAQVLDVYDLYAMKKGDHGKTGADIDQTEPFCPTISERFMGLRAALFSNCPIVASFARSLGFLVLQLNESSKETDPSRLLPEVSDTIVSKLLWLLGFSGGIVLENHDFDLVFLHVRASEETNTNCNADWLDKLVRGIMQTVCLGSQIASRLHFSVLLSYGTVSESDENCSLISNSSMEINTDLSLLRPRQSYYMKGANIVHDIRHHHPILIAQWQEAVTRRDLASVFSFDEFKEHGSNLSILADRFLYEVAFKLWKAPKYGA